MDYSPPAQRERMKKEFEGSGANHSRPGGLFGIIDDILQVGMLAHFFLRQKFPILDPALVRPGFYQGGDICISADDCADNFLYNTTERNNAEYLHVEARNETTKITLFERVGCRYEQRATYSITKPWHELHWSDLKTLGVYTKSMSFERIGNHQ